jgi:hypothetical protein
MPIAIRNYAFFILLLSCFVLFSCDKDDDNNETLISSFSDSESHNNGQNCMGCHVSGGDGEGWFVVAGSVYDSTQINPYRNAQIILTTGPNGTGNTIKNVEVDMLGNFYTTESVNFETELYVSVVDTNGVKTFMNTNVTTGQCNTCHGSSVGRIFVP